MFNFLKPKDVWVGIFVEVTFEHGMFVARGSDKHDKGFMIASGTHEQVDVAVTNFLANSNYRTHTFSLCPEWGQ